MTTKTLSKTLATMLALCCCATPALAQHQQQLRLEWGKNVTEYRGQHGRRLMHVCPPQGQPLEVYGTDTYTDDSSVCSAAVHAGLITLAGGGVVTVVIEPGRSSYPGSARNGVTSRDFGSWQGSFSFNRSSTEAPIDWETRGVGVELAGRPLTVVCPPGGESQSVWGTDVYTDDSSICVAAVHAGLITFARGGRVTVEGAGDQTSYAASDRNGVRSREYGSMPNGFRVSAAGGTATVTAARTADGASRSGSIATPAPTTTAPPATKTVANLPAGPILVSSLSRTHFIDAPALTLTGLYMSARTLIAPPLVLTGIHMPARTLTAPPLTLIGTAP